MNGDLHSSNMNSAGKKKKQDRPLENPLHFIPISKCRDEKHFITDVREDPFIRLSLMKTHPFANSTMSSEKEKEVMTHFCSRNHEEK